MNRLLQSPNLEVQRTHRAKEASAATRPIRLVSERAAVQARAVHVRDILLEDGEARKHHSVVGTTREFCHEPWGGYKEGRKSL